MCERVLLNPSFETVSLIDVSEELVVNEASSAAKVELAIVSSWFRPDSEPGKQTKTRFRIYDPRQIELSTSAELEIDLREHTRAVTVGRIHRMPLHGLGVYEFVVEQKVDKRWTHCARIPLEVRAAL